MGDIYTTHELIGVRVEHAKKPGKRIGRVRHFIFHPHDLRVVGFAVKRPDAALMFHRSDIFVALDGYQVVEGAIMINDDSESTGRAACKRLGISWDECVIWQGLPLMTEDEQRLGHVGDVSFDAQTGEVVSLKVDKGASVDFLLGSSELPANLIEGFKIGIGDNLSKVSEDDFFRGAIVVRPEALSLEREGGMAEKAGAGAAIAAHKVGEAKNKATEKLNETVRPKVNDAAQKAGDAVNKGAYNLGVQLSKTRGMFSNFKEEYKKALESDKNDE